MFRRLSPPFKPGAVSPAHEAVKAASGLVTQVNSEQDVYSPKVHIKAPIASFSPSPKILLTESQILSDLRARKVVHEPLYALAPNLRDSPQNSFWFKLISYTGKWFVVEDLV